MSLPVTHVVKVSWKQILPWLILWQSFGLALHVRQVLVGSLAAFAIAVPHWYLLGESMPYVHLQPSPTNIQGVLWPLAPVMDLLAPLMQTAETTESGLVAIPTWTTVGKGVFLTLWTLLIGGLAGGVLARRAAFEFAREESTGLWKTSRFVFGRAADYLSAPLLPLAAVVFIGVCGMLSGWFAGLIGRAISLESGILTAIWILPLVCGVFAACLSLAIIAGWPMMVAAVSVNGGDGFDALSRGFGCVLDRWRYYAFCTLFLLLYGNVALFMTLVVLNWGEALTNSSIALGLGALPHPAWTLDSALNPWHCFLSILFTGFAYSFFWSGMTLTYLLLRKSLDDAELDSIYLDDPVDDSDGLAALLKKNPVPEQAPTLLPIIDLPLR